MHCGWPTAGVSGGPVAYAGLRSEVGWGWGWGWVNFHLPLRVQTQPCRQTHFDPSFGKGSTFHSIKYIRSLHLFAENGDRRKIDINLFICLSIVSGYIIFVVKNLPSV